MHASGKKYTDKEFMEMIDSGHMKPGTMREGRQQMPSMEIKRPWFGGPMMTSTYVSRAPYKSYGSMPIPDDIGAMRQAESQKVTRKKLGGKSIANPLHYRKPQMENDSAAGSKDKIC